MTGNVNFLIVAIDYFNKWIEGKPLAKIDVAHVKKFIWEFIICNFGLAYQLVSEKGTQFTDQHLQEWVTQLGGQQIFTSVVHPQWNGKASMHDSQPSK